jgi:AcrR family transcriptional regulator
MIAETPPPGPRLPIGGTTLQRRIAEAAIDLFYSRGAAATTVRDITAACGLTPGALYNHFSSKEELLYVLIRDIHRLADEGLAAALAAAGPQPPERLAAAVRFMVAQAGGLRKQSLVANRDYTTLPADMQDEITVIRRRMRGRFAGILLEGSATGDFVLPGGQDRLTAALTANAIGMLCADISLWTRTNYPVPLDDLQERYVLMSLRLAGARDPEQQPD